MSTIVRAEHVPPAHWVGDGFHVRSLISPSVHAKELDPFLLLDHAAPETFAPATQPRGVGTHPHKGFETVTIVYDGELEHRDSTGSGGRIGAGDVQWMTAGNGILHQEFHSNDFTRKGGSMEMVQLWVNLPARHKSSPPGYQTILKADIPVVTLEDGAGELRVIAGSFRSLKGPARTFTPIEIWDMRLKAGKHISLPLPQGHTAALALLDGAVLINGQRVRSGTPLVILDRSGGGVSVEATSDAKLLLLAGEPIGEPVVAHGPFVMTTLGEIKQAMLDFQNGRFGSID